MDGLECSEIMLSRLKREMRIDSEYFKKKYLQDDLYMSINSAAPIKCFVTDGQHGYHETDEHSAIHMLSAKNAMNWFADIAGALPVAKWVDDNNKRSSLHSGDLVLTTRGSVGHCAIVEPDILPANLDQDLARIEILDSRFCPEYVLTYLNSKYGQDWMTRNQSGMIQQGLPLQKVRELPVPHLSLSLQKQIAFTIQQASKFRAASKHIYSSAQALLLSALNYHPIIQTSNHTEKSFSSSFGAVGRLDAEYYQPKYDALFQMLSALTTRRLKSVVHITKSIEPGCAYYRNEGIPFIRVSDVSRDGINTPAVRIPKTTVPSIENLYPKKDTILFSKDGSVGIAYKVEDDMEAVTSGALLHLTVKDTAEVLPDYLTLLLNSDVVRLQAERDASGAIIQHWKPSDIEQVIVPILPLEMQQQIAEKIEESFYLRRQSKQLLENAKHVVEMAIEQGENTAMRWLQEQDQI